MKSSIVPVDCDLCHRKAKYTGTADGRSIGLPVKTLFLCGTCVRRYAKPGKVVA